MRILTFLIALLSLSQLGYGQRVKYKDLFPTLSSLSNEEIKDKLKEYLAQDLDNPNANFRLAYVYEINYRRADPLTAFEFAMANAEQTKVRYIKSKQLVDEREVERNNEYYFPLFKTFDANGKPYVNFVQVQQKIDNGYDSANLFMERMPTIYGNFTRSVYHYDLAAKLFAGISSRYHSTEDLLLLHNNELDAELGKLKMHYDSTLIFLNQYLELIKAYPVHNHQQHYQVQLIKTYRLDGLQSRVNFLVNAISLWDYGIWVNQVREKVGTDIISLRTKLKQQEVSLDKSLEKASSISFGDSYPLMTLDKQSMFALANFDRQSLVQSLFNYKAFKQEYIRQRKQLQVDTLISERNAQVYTQLIYSNRKADTLLLQVKTDITPLKIEKHKDFLTTYYKGKTGLDSMVQMEETAIRDDFRKQSSLIKTVVRQMQIDYAGEPGKIVRVTGTNVPLFILTGDSLPVDNLLHTRKLIRNPDGSLYAGGMYRPDKKPGNLVVFVAKINPEGKGEWFKSFNLKADSLSKNAFDNMIGPMTLTKEGCVFIIHTKEVSVPTGQPSTARRLNTLVYLSEKGEEKKRKKLAELNYPRYITYNESINGIVILLKGDLQNENTITKENIVLLSYNVLGDQLWKTEIPLMGNVIKLSNLNDGYAIAGNYLLITDLDGKEFRTRITEQEVNPYFIKIKITGEISFIKPLSLSTTLVTTRVVKINDSSIHLLGYNGTLASQKSNQELTSHIMINSSGQIILNDHIQ